MKGLPLINCFQIIRLSKNINNLRKQLEILFRIKETSWELEKIKNAHLSKKIILSETSYSPPHFVKFTTEVWDRMWPRYQP